MSGLQAGANQVNIDEAKLSAVEGDLAADVARSRNAAIATFTQAQQQVTRLDGRIDVANTKVNLLLDAVIAAGLVIDAATYEGIVGAEGVQGGGQTPA